MLNIDDRLITEVMPKVGTKAFCVLLAISKHLGKNNSAWPGAKTLQEITGLGRDAIRDSIKQLVDNRLLTVKQQNKNGIFSSNIYTVKTSLIKIFVSAGSFDLQELPCPENQSPDMIPCPENPATENQGTKELIIPFEVLNTYKDLGSNFETKEPPHDNQIVNNLLKTGKATFANQIETHTARRDPSGEGLPQKTEKRAHRRSGEATGTSRVITFPYESEDFLETWQMWKNYKSEEHRFKFKSAFSEQASLNKLNKLSNGSESDAKEIIMESISNGWQGFYELKTKPNNIPADLDNYDLPPVMLEDYNNYLIDVQKDYPTLLKSNCRIYSKDDFFDLLTDRTVTARKYRITDRKFKALRDQAHRDMAEKGYLRNEFKTVYAYTRKLMRQELEYA